MHSPAWLPRYAPLPETGMHIADWYADWTGEAQPVASEGGLCPHLHKAMFGPSGGDTPHCYAVLDGALMTNLPELLDLSGLDHACLFQGDAADTLGAQAPWLVRLEPDHPFTLGLFTDSPADWHFWGRDCGVFIRSKGGLTKLRAHLRRFTRLQGSDGRWFFFRFWQPEMLGALALRGPADFVRPLLCGPDIARWIVPTEGAVLTLAVLPGATQAAGPDARLAAPRVDAATRAAMGQHVADRFWFRLHRDLVARSGLGPHKVQAVLDLISAHGFSSREAIRDLAEWWCSPQGARFLASQDAQDDLHGSAGSHDLIRRDRLRNLAELQAMKEARHAAR